MDPTKLYENCRIAVALAAEGHADFANGILPAFAKGIGLSPGDVERIATMLRTSPDKLNRRVDRILSRMLREARGPATGAAAGGSAWPRRREELRELVGRHATALVDVSRNSSNILAGDVCRIESYERHPAGGSVLRVRTINASRPGAGSYQWQALYRIPADREALAADFRLEPAGFVPPAREATPATDQLPADAPPLPAVGTRFVARRAVTQHAAMIAAGDVCAVESNRDPDMGYDGPCLVMVQTHAGFRYRAWYEWPRQAAEFTADFRPEAAPADAPADAPALPAVGARFVARRAFEQQIARVAEGQTFRVTEAADGIVRLMAVTGTMWGLSYGERLDGDETLADFAERFRPEVETCEPEPGRTFVARRNVWLEGGRRIEAGERCFVSESASAYDSRGEGRRAAATLVAFSDQTRSVRYGFPSQAEHFAADFAPEASPATNQPADAPAWPPRTAAEARAFVGREFILRHGRYTTRVGTRYEVTNVRGNVYPQHAYIEFGIVGEGRGDLLYYLPQDANMIAEDLQPA